VTYSVIIPSNDPRKLRRCIDSLVEAQPDIDPARVVIVSDGLPLRLRWELRGARWVRGRRPFVFAQAINAGVAATEPGSDIVILADDVRLDTTGAIDKLAAASEGAAAVAPVVDGLCGQVAQRAMSTAPTAEWLAFICVYIPRAVWDDVGELDERFVGYGYDDVDWCLRARDHGPLRVARDVLITHIDDSAYRSDAGWLKLYADNRVRFEEKWATQ